jgi:hypothetical protein
MGRIFVLLILVLVGYFIWRATQGTDVPNAPDTPNLPDLGNPETGAKKTADWLTTLPPWVWNFAVPIGIVIVVLMFMKKNHPAVFWISVGIGTAVFGIYALQIAPS